MLWGYSHGFSNFAGKHYTSMGRTALVFGSTGLIGSHLLQWLATSGRYDLIRVFQRGELSPALNGMELIEVDFSRLENLSAAIKGDDLFCCLGTTRKKAGSREGFRKVDFEYPAKIAKIASSNGVTGFFVVSSLGADPGSSNFYLRTKGEMEQAIQEAGLPRLGIFRPSLLMGKRKEFRLGEKISQAMFPLVGWMLTGKFRKYRGIRATDVAKAMVEVALGGFPSSVFESDGIAAIAKKSKL